ncbi:hypothetical protein ACWDA9_33390, partial [Streptomyces sp. NPDC001193]
MSQLNCPAAVKTSCHDWPNAALYGGAAPARVRLLNARRRPAGIRPSVFVVRTARLLSAGGLVP